MQIIKKSTKISVFLSFFRSIFSFCKLSHKKTRKITDKGTGVWLQHLLEGIVDGIVEIHDIKIKFNSDLHEYLLDAGYIQHKDNKSIPLEIQTAEKHLTVKTLAYPKTVQIDIGCSNEPFTHDSAGALRLSSLLSRVKEVLSNASGNRAKICDMGEWIVTHRHVGIDGKIIGLSGTAFNITVNDLTRDFTRAYTKILPDGRTILRLEKVLTDHIHLVQMIQEMREKSTAIFNYLKG